ncbi:MAG: hypothetical protein JXA49_02320 [Actinobacteria bacterium]|nr:hypothetical protein [Actinomycetota bacterium]
MGKQFRGGIDSWGYYLKNRANSPFFDNIIFQGKVINNVEKTALPGM